MKTYISFLRGINVSGQKKILMKELSELYVNIGFTEVNTYLQSGNVVFKSGLKLTETKMAKLIEDQIEDKFHFQVPVIIRTKNQLESIFQRNPFKNDDKESLYVTFLSNTPNANQLEKLENISYLPDNFEIIDKEIYLCVTAYGSTKLSNNFFESKLKVTATTRNIKTIEQLIQKSNETK
jgi:uncharacterized protein (DUF1697 family)